MARYSIGIDLGTTHSAVSSLDLARETGAVSNAAFLQKVDGGLALGARQLELRLVLAAGNADMFFFAFGAPKVREVDATVGGILALEVPESGMPEAKKILAGGYLTMVQPNPFYVGVPKAMNVYTWDNMLFTNSKVSDDVVYKLIDTMVKNKDDMLTIQPALREFTAAGLYKKYDIPYHPGALKYFSEHKIDAKSVN